MKVDKSTVEKIAHLSRLYFNENDEEKMLQSLNDIIGWVDKLSEVDTEGVTPLTHMTEELNVMRDDTNVSNLNREEGLANAPQQNGEYFKVPRVLD
ncbi:Asp-tRNA(Asn)/Glu-tRNA(Gln) amidotransferase subunit GatC [Chondrinema litorale]|uniref:Asp-tRNA(Asn)/Glu-tRNA(Gln) amidotransferase subunit GatC n=1 Tax=Chondrinema litorale TaxID=2994555 RepID=UPI000C4C8D43|nr:Asp-tRNA(Asn)/Glu-tRNA(Gln) amidotransferase subunit GatC [Chondrinema litorale]MBT28126.1 Asp-tRNA(Asn)/Glu-tRNA(Gln) amidotransferase GatCAB subunit C [Thalassovita sp.]UZR95562.1 Asp-tRNA(Asn)/Glu-tRNA(Gln) amidotransferase subunit GatC [Chondrinema litorale]